VIQFSVSPRRLLIDQEIGLCDRTHCIF
jgi:hypothetical protein